uniref:Innexin n=1 Tax=Macrostomum lignano TaxID=282301 RepID=A0A1I8FDE6_9PLAT
LPGNRIWPCSAFSLHCQWTPASSRPSALQFTSASTEYIDDDAVDRINSYYAPVLIVIMSSIVMTKMYPPGDPFKPAWEQYAETYCWLKNTYFVPPNGSIPGDETVRQGEELKYYQWAAVRAGYPGTHVPLAGWVQIKTLVGMAVNCCVDDREARGQDQEAGLVLSKPPFEKKIRKQSGFFYNLKKVLIRYLLIGRAAYGRYLINVYIVIKLLYIANVVGQFFLLNGFLGTDYDFYGLGVLRDLWNNHDWRHSGHFPRVTLCDFNVRVIGNSHPRDSAIFVFLWFMLLFVRAVVTILDAPVLAGSRSLPGDAPQMLNLRTCTSHSAVDLEQFFNDYIDSDGAFLLRMIGKNAGEPVLKELLQRLWADYRAPLMNRAAAKGASSAYERQFKQFTAAVGGFRNQLEAIRLQICGSGCGGCGGGGGGGGGIQEQPTWLQRLSASSSCTERCCCR